MTPFQRAKKSPEVEHENWVHIRVHMEDQRDSSICLQDVCLESYYYKATFIYLFISDSKHLESWFCSDVAYTIKEFITRTNSQLHEFAVKSHTRIFPFWSPEISSVCWITYKISQTSKGRTHKNYNLMHEWKLWKHGQ